MRKNRDAHGIRTLICCIGNQAVDAAARKLMEIVSDGNDGTFVSSMVRLGRQGYEYGDLRSISLRGKALPFYGPFTGRHKSSKTKKLFAKECAVFL